MMKRQMLNRVNRGSRRLSVLSLMLVLILVVSACAYQQPGGAVVDRPLEEEPVEEEPLPEEPLAESTSIAEDPLAEEVIVATERGVQGAQDDAMMLASSILDREVESPDREQLGFVDNFFFDLQTGNVLFAVVEHGGFLDIGSEHVPVPLSAMALSPDVDELILKVPSDVAQDVLDALPDLGDEDWLPERGTTWADELASFFGEAGMQFEPTVFTDVSPARIASAETVVGTGVGYAGTPGIANVDDLVVDIGEGKIEYALLTFTDVGVYGRDWIAVPWEAYEPAFVDDELVFAEAVNVDLMRTAPRIPRTRFTDMVVIEPGWDEEIQTFWTDAGILSAAVVVADETPAATPSPEAEGVTETETPEAEVTELQITETETPEAEVTETEEATATPTPAEEAEANEVQVELVEFEIRMPDELRAGATQFVVTNDGTIMHNFEIEGQGIEEVFEQNLQPGETRTMTVDLQPGEYRVYCPVPGHAEQGMEMILTVTED